MATDDLYSPLPAFHLASVAIRSFRGLVKLTVPFSRRLTVLVGENGAGKTSVLDAIHAGLAPKLAGGGRVAPSDRTREASEGVEILLTLSDGQTWGRSEHDFLGDLQLTRMPAYASFPADRRFSEERAFARLSGWLRGLDVEEALTIRERQDLGYRHPKLEAVRRAVASLIPGAANLRAATNALTVDHAVGEHRMAGFPVSQLSGGVRMMLMVVADIAQRLLERHGDDGLTGPGLVLIDEVDLHLHPRWQLSVVDALLETFPGVQFIVTTHSEEIFATVPSACIVSLRATDEGVVAERPPDLRGARFDEALQDGMGLGFGRPPAAQGELDAYHAMIRDGLGETDEARAARAALRDRWPGLELELVRADFELRRRRLDARRATGS
ncbi:MAG TPA: AAA family ATPase [Myxococcota bacterium]|nr:AAA family ATPase [Myxococcota bacterium]